MKLIVFLIASLSLIVSCKKKIEEAPVTANISISSISENDTILPSDALHLSGTITGSAEMHGYTVTFTNLTTGNPVFSKVYDLHSASYSIDETWTNNVSDTSTVQLKIVVEKDHDGNLETKTINVVCLP
jgi:hypothetical protein